jgi:SAM-dependent methyltransferase
VTVHPFCEGGERRLALNAKHPLIIALAKAAASRNPEKQRQAIAMGENLLMTNTWPMAGLDVFLPNQKLHWKTAKGLICGPHFTYISPVPHKEIVTDLDMKSLAIWPRKIQSIQLKADKGDPSSTKEKCVILSGEIWARRDEMLWDEWKRRRSTWEWKNCFLPVSKKLIRSRAAESDLQSLAMATFAPCLPVLVLARFLQRNEESEYEIEDEGAKETMKYLKTNIVDAFRSAASILISSDRLFCLSLFFGVPLIDRTNTLFNSICVDTVVRSTPSIEEVNEYRANVPNDAHQALEKAMLRRAKEIWQNAQGRKIIVCWSGGIDSTALLVCLLRTIDAKENEYHSDQLLVTYDEESISENLSFYNTHINSKLKTIHRDNKTMSELAMQHSNALIITGELGDQLFGSDKCKDAFSSETTESFSVEEELILKSLGIITDNPVEVSLDEPWKEAVIKMLENRGLLAGTSLQWIDWIEPQIHKAPFPITNLHDMFWWLNFSCKWQTVSLRCLHDGGTYEPKEALTGSIIHFYDDRQLECWACVKDFHDTKFADLKDWKTYKEPLKKMIYSYHPDLDYYRNKEKVGSLALSVSEVQEKRIEKCLGVFRSRNGTLQRLELGVGGFEQYLGKLLNPWIIHQEESHPRICERQIKVDPWKDSHAAFTSAPYFADEDERQRRFKNPVTMNTLNAKCSALLPAEMVRGKRILDLGACLGAMCHWSLFYGASEAVAVEPQRNFCDRMTTFLKRAEATWPAIDDSSMKSSGRYKVVCTDARSFLAECGDNSFDIVIAAGVLHCFQDPVSILSELARVCKESIVVESVHTNATRKGLLGTSAAQTNFLELAPAAQVNKAGKDASFSGVASVPSKELIESVLSLMGFSISTVVVPRHPTENADVLTYTGNKAFEASSLRFFLQCNRKTHRNVNLKSLEDVVVTGKGNEHNWIDANASLWTTFSQSELKESSQGTSFRKEFPEGSSSIRPQSYIAWNDVNSQAHNMIFDGSKDQYPYKVNAWGKESECRCFTNDDPKSAIYGYVHDGNAKITRSSRNSCIEDRFSNILEADKMNLKTGMFFCCPGVCKIEGGSGIAINVPVSLEKKNRYLFTVSGPLKENEDGNLIGTLPYIDGCTDTILLHPQLLGDPCLNHLHFPNNISQTQHTHPSGRAGMVIKGKGNCVVIDQQTKVATKTPLIPGMVFVIPRDATHAFETENCTLDVIAFHPDSDCGPTSTNHPMVNRTMVNGISASAIPSIQTKVD